MKYTLLLFSVLIFSNLKSQTETPVKLTDSLIIELIDSISYLQKTAFEQNKKDPKSKQNQIISGKTNNYFDLKFRPKLKGIVNYIIVNNKSKLEDLFLTYLSNSTESVDETLGNSFIVLFIKRPDIIIKKLKVINQKSLNKYLEEWFEFYVSENAMDKESKEDLQLKIRKLMLTQG